MRIINRWRLPQVAAWHLVLLPAFGLAHEHLPGDNLTREWLAVQTNRDQQAKKGWWQHLDRDRLVAFIEAGADANASDRRGWTPLHSAARFNPDKEVLLALIQAGANVNARDRSGDTPLHWAAAENTNVEIVTSLIEAGADVNARDKFGWLPLHTAAEGSSNPEVIGALMSAGAKRYKRAYFILFSPAFLLKYNSNMSEEDKKIALASLKSPSKQPAPRT